jgi:hypothetical protein
MAHVIDKQGFIDQSHRRLSVLNMGDWYCGMKLTRLEVCLFNAAKQQRFVVVKRTRTRNNLPDAWFHYCQRNRCPYVWVALCPKRSEVHYDPDSHLMYVTAAGVLALEQLRNRVCGEFRGVIGDKFGHLPVATEVADIVAAQVYDICAEHLGDERADWDRDAGYNRPAESDSKST